MFLILQIDSIQLDTLFRQVHFYDNSFLFWKKKKEIRYLQKFDGSNKDKFYRER